MTRGISRGENRNCRMELAEVESSFGRFTPLRFIMKRETRMDLILKQPHRGNEIMKD